MIVTLRQAKQAVENLQVRVGKEQNNKNEIEVYLDWGRDGEEDLQYFTTIKNVPNDVMKEMERKFAK